MIAGVPRWAPGWSLAGMASATAGSLAKYQRPVLVDADDDPDRCRRGRRHRLHQCLRQYRRRGGPGHCRLVEGHDGQLLGRAVRAGGIHGRQRADCSVRLYLARRVGVGAVVVPAEKRTGDRDGRRAVRRTVGTATRATGDTMVPGADDDDMGDVAAGHGAQTEYARRVSSEIGVFARQGPLHRLTGIADWRNGMFLAPALGAAFGQTTAAAIYATSIAAAIQRCGSGQVFSLGCGDGEQEIAILHAAPTRSALFAAFPDPRTGTIADFPRPCSRGGQRGGPERTLHPAGARPQRRPARGRGPRRRHGAPRPAPHRRAGAAVRRHRRRLHPDGRLEGVRAQDILRLLAERFEPEDLVLWGGISQVFLTDRTGPNFDPASLPIAASSPRSSNWKRICSSAGAPRLLRYAARSGLAATASRISRNRGASGPWHPAAGRTLSGDRRSGVSLAISGPFRRMSWAWDLVTRCANRIEPGSVTPPRRVTVGKHQSRGGVRAILDEQSIVWCAIPVAFVDIQVWNPCPTAHRQTLHATTENGETTLGPLAQGESATLRIVSPRPRKRWDIRIECSAYVRPEQEGLADKRPLAWRLSSIDPGSQGGRGLLSRMFRRWRVSAQGA